MRPRTSASSLPPTPGGSTPSGMARAEGSPPSSFPSNQQTQSAKIKYIVHSYLTFDFVCLFEGNEDGELPSARAIPEGVLPPGVGGKLLADVPCLMVLGNLLGGV